MNNEKTKVSVLVAGQRFTLVTEKSEKYVIELADRIDARINSLIISGEMSRERASVLTALDFADDNENDKDAIREIKEQIKDYLSEIERLNDDRAKLSADYSRLKEEYERLIAERASADEAETALKESREEVTSLKAQNAALEQELSSLKAQTAQILEAKANQEKETREEEVPIPQEAPEERETAPVITADDDLPFDEPEEPVIKPQKKKRHEHKHVNPYQKRAADQKEQKGYTPQRQYTFFDLEEQ